MINGSPTKPDTGQLSYLYDEEGVPYAGAYRSPAASTTPVVFAMVTTDRGDVVELLDAGGAPFAAYRYGPWGKPTSTVTQGTTLINATLAAQIAARQVLRYAGYVYDPDIGTASCGTYYLSARHYDPATRQFLSKDPAKADGEESAYQYCGGEPVGMVDPTGESLMHPDTGTFYTDPSVLKQYHKIWCIYTPLQYTAVRGRIRTIAKRVVGWDVPYHTEQPLTGGWYPDPSDAHDDYYNAPGYKYGPLDCSGFVQGVIHEAVHKGKRHPEMPWCTPGTKISGTNLVLWAGRRGNPQGSARWFHNPGDVPWRIGDVVSDMEQGKEGHIVLVIKDGRNPRFAECTPYSDADGTRTQEHLAGYSWWKSEKSKMRAGRYFQRGPSHQ